MSARPVAEWKPLPVSLPDRVRAAVAVMEAAKIDRDEAIVAMRDAGFTMREIAEAASMVEATAYSIIQRLQP